MASCELIPSGTGAQVLDLNKSHHIYFVRGARRGYQARLARVGIYRRGEELGPSIDASRDHSGKGTAGRDPEWFQAGFRHGYRLAAFGFELPAFESVSHEF